MFNLSIHTKLLSCNKEMITTYAIWIRSYISVETINIIKFIVWPILYVATHRNTSG